MAKIKLKKWDSAEHLKTDEDMAHYLEACLEEAGDDAAFIAKALGNIARATFGASIPNPSLACVVLGVGLVTGNIAPTSGYALNADSLTDFELVCGAGSGSDILVFSIGYAFGGSVGGLKR